LQAAREAALALLRQRPSGTLGPSGLHSCAWSSCILGCGRAGESPSLAAKEAVYALLTALLGHAAAAGGLVPPPQAPAGSEPEPPRGLPLHACAPLEEARWATLPCTLTRFAQAGPPER